MRAPLVVVTGTGTEIGKTHVATALLRAWGRHVQVAGLKPIETGVAPGSEGEDARRLREASTFHVKPWPTAPYTFRDPVSPHLAARTEARTIEREVVRGYCEAMRDRAGGVLVELPGGLFSPVSEAIRNIDIAKALAPDRVYLVAADRLGVLHDLAATTIAASAEGLSIAGVIFSAPAVPDASSGTNAAEARFATSAPILGGLPRATSEELARHPTITAQVTELLRLSSAG